MSKPRPTKLPATRLANVKDIVGDRHVIRITAGPLLEPVILSVREAPQYRHPTLERTVSRKVGERNDFRVHYLVDGEWRVIELAPTLENYHLAQPLGDGEWLLVSRGSTSDDDRNAHVYNSDGIRRRSFPAANGIEDVQTTRSSKIWISFFDEGVYGNIKMGQSGLICLDKHGKRLHDFAAIAASTGYIDDCYAINVCDEHNVWLYYYDDFPLVKLTDGKLAKVWRGIPVKGSRAFAVADARDVFAGSYKDRNTLFDVRPDGRVRRFEPVDENGSRISGFVAFGRSHCLFIATDESIFLFDFSRL